MSYIMDINDFCVHDTSSKSYNNELLFYIFYFYIMILISTTLTIVYTNKLETELKNTKNKLDIYIEKYRELSLSSGESDESEESDEYQESEESCESDNYEKSDIPNKSKKIGYMIFLITAKIILL